VDSRKRANGDRRITIDPGNDELPVDWYHTNGELIELVSANDIVATLAQRLRPRERAVLRGLANGLVLHEIAVELKLSYPTALKCRRTIAALTIRLGISPPAQSTKLPDAEDRIAARYWPFNPVLGKDRKVLPRKQAILNTNRSSPRGTPCARRGHKPVPERI
jgi:hypothetical protein